MPPGARPWMRPDTVTVIVGSCRIRASMRASAWTNARSSPDADRRNAAGAIECRNSDGEAGPRRLGMAWPGIRGIRIEPGSNLVLQFCQLALKRIVGVEMRWDKCCLGWIDRHPSAHQIGAGRQGQEVALDPIRRDDGIGVRCQKYAVVTRKFGSGCHCQPARIAGAGGGCREGVGSDVQRIRKADRQRLGNRGGAVDTVVGQQQDRIGLPCLPCERAKTRPRYGQLRPWQGSRRRWDGWIDAQVSGHGSASRSTTSRAGFRPGPPILVAGI